MLKNNCKLELRIGEKIYEFLCDSDSPLDHVQIALNEFVKYTQQYIDSIKNSQNSKSENEKIEEINGNQ